MDSGRKYSHCGNNAHDSRTCNGKSMKLFGMVICRREEEVVTRKSSSIFKRGKWTEEEHKRFLLGLEKLGKGNWRGISENFVKTRSPSQVASHAQKYFLRKATPSTKKRRYSMLDGDESSETGPLQPKRTNGAAEEINRLRLNNYSLNDKANASSATQVAVSSFEDTPTVPLAAKCVQKRHLTGFNHTSSGTSYGTKNQAVERSTQVTPDSSSFPPSPSCSSSAAYSMSTEATGLELTIGPPKSHMNVLNYLQRSPIDGRQLRHHENLSKC